jgi:hypothetical protein
MKTLLFLLVLFAVSAAALAQMPWSAPMLLADSVANNFQPTFVKDINEFFDVYNMMFWQRDYGDRSLIFFKSFENPQIEVPISPDLPGVYCANPSAGMTIYPNPEGFLIVWQSNQNGNEDLFSLGYWNGQFGQIIQVTSDTLDDINPFLRSNYLVWERDGSILFSEFSVADSAWSAETVLDSNASHPVVSDFSYGEEVMAAYEKDGHIYLRKRNQSNVWLPSQQMASSGENARPQIIPGFWFYLLWQQRRDALDDWDIFSYDFDFQEIDSLDLGSGDETNIQGVEFRWIGKESLILPTVTAFEGNTTGNLEIYTMDSGGFPANVSEFDGVDTLPALSDYSYAEGQSQPFRVWCAWQRYLNGKWQIWGSFTELNWGLGIPTEGKEINSFTLSQNYPNPFNPVTTIAFYLPHSGDIQLEIYDLMGQKIRTLAAESIIAGSHQVEWDGRDNAGKNVASGIYVYRLKGGNFIQSRKMLLLR